MDGQDRPIVWLSGEIRTPPFTRQARIEAGFLLRRLQQGERLGMPHSRPMPSVGPACHELRIVDQDANWRILYHLDADAVVILEIWNKTTRETPQRVIEVGRRRLRLYREACGQEGEP